MDNGPDEAPGGGHQHPAAPVRAGRGGGARVQAVLHLHEQPSDRGHLDRVRRVVGAGGGDPGALNPRHPRGRVYGQMARASTTCGAVCSTGTRRGSATG